MSHIRNGLKVLMLMAILVGCANVNNFKANSSSGNDQGGELPDEIQLVASKSYGPSSWDDGIFDEDVDIGADVRFSIEIPASISVTSGNAGNHHLTIIVDADAGKTCTYKGGADISKPIPSGNTTQINKGLFYHFESCAGGEVAGDLLVVESTIRVTVNNGDTTETTAVEVVFPVVPL